MIMGVFHERCSLPAAVARSASAQDSAHLAAVLAALYSSTCRAAHRSTRKDAGARMDDAAARQRATDVVAFLRGDVAQLLSHGLVKDFFADALWDRLPSSWHTPIDELAADFGALAALLHRPDVGDAASWPLSLRAFVAAAHALRLPGQLDARGEAPAEGGAGAAAPRARAPTRTVGARSSGTLRRRCVRRSSRRRCTRSCASPS